MMDWKNKKVFISGGSGVIGSALVEDLLKKEASLFIGDLKAKSENWKQIQYREGDLISLKKEEIQEFAPEIYFHLAATFERSVETEEFWGENYHHNIALSHHLLSLQKDLPSLKKIVFASSYLIYNSDNYLFESPQLKAQPLSESSPVAPRNLCGMAKMLHEQELLFIHKFRPELQIVNARIFRSYGKNSRDIISRWIRAILKKEKITVYCPEGRFDFVYADDVAKALLYLAETDFTGTVNIGTGRSRTIQEVLKILKQHLGPVDSQIEKVEIPFEASEANISLLNSLANSLHFKSLEEAIPDLISYEKSKLI